MAGITGIYWNKAKRSQPIDKAILTKMINAAKVTDSQLSQSYIGETLFCADILPQKKSENDRFFLSNEPGILCLVDGYIFISKDEKSALQSEYSETIKLSDYACLPYLYRKYKDDIALHLTGSFNLLIYDINNERTLITNDRFGFLPFYYYANEILLAFGSKIECILASGVIDKPAFDKVTIAEHLLFKYPISDNTFIRKINTLPNASILSIDSAGLCLRKYWSIGEEFSSTELNKPDSFNLIDESLSASIETIMHHVPGKVNFSLTGGWDSRVVLSYLLPEYKDIINCYSFGAYQSDDIEIPKLIAEQEGFCYRPFVLDSQYMENTFYPFARKTIESSGGTRNYKRTHYLYAIEQMSGLSDTLITGIFGDEVLKVGSPQAGDVISANLISLINDGFDTNRFLAHYKNSPVYTIPGFSAQDHIDDLVQRIASVKKSLCVYQPKSEQLSAFRFEYNLRKFFGNEASSYNDYTYCHSPFFDYNFVSGFFKTMYSGHRYSYEADNLHLKRQTTDLYSKLVMKEYVKLAKYPSSRGYSMADSQNIIGRMKIVYKRYLKKSNRVNDAFNTSTSDKLFKDSLVQDGYPDNILSITDNPNHSKSLKSDLLSLRYWISYIENKYNMLNSF